MQIKMEIIESREKYTIFENSTKTLDSVKYTPYILKSNLETEIIRRHLHTKATK